MTKYKSEILKHIKNQLKLIYAELVELKSDSNIINAVDYAIGKIEVK